MSKDNVKKFYEMLKSNKALAEAFNVVVTQAKQQTQENAVNFVIDFAADNGCAFSADDLKDFESEVKELSIDELDGVNAAGYWKMPSQSTFCNMLAF